MRNQFRAALRDIRAHRPIVPELGPRAQARAHDLATLRRDVAGILPGWRRRLSRLIDGGDHRDAAAARRSLHRLQADHQRLHRWWHQVSAPRDELRALSARLDAIGRWLQLRHHTVLHGGSVIVYTPPKPAGLRRVADARADEPQRRVLPMETWAVSVSFAGDLHTPDLPDGVGREVLRGLVIRAALGAGDAAAADPMDRVCAELRQAERGRLRA